MWYNIRYLKLIFFLHSLVILQEMTLMKPLLKRAFGNLPLKFSSYPYNQLFLNGPIPVSFCWFLSFSYYIFNNPNWKSVDTVLRIWIRGHWMVGADEITELWRPPILTINILYLLKIDHRWELSGQLPDHFSYDSSSKPCEVHSFSDFKRRK